MGFSTALKEVLHMCRVENFVPCGHTLEPVVKYSHLQLRMPQSVSFLF